MLYFVFTNYQKKGHDEKRLGITALIYSYTICFKPNNLNSIKIFTIHLNP